MAVTLPVTCASTAAIATDAVCPTAIEARSLSTTSAVTSNVAASMTIASPVGASRPLATLTVVTMPAIGEVSVASLIWVARSARVLSADDSWVSALLTPILAWRICAVTFASFASDRLALAARRPIRAVSTAVFASASWRLRSAVSAVARTWPALTVSPTLTLRSVTVQVVDPAFVVAPARWAGAPKVTP